MKKDQVTEAFGTAPLDEAGAVPASRSIAAVRGYRRVLSATDTVLRALKRLEAMSAGRESLPHGWERGV
jgi:hypothetical protein